VDEFGIYKSEVWNTNLIIIVNSLIDLTILLVFWYFIESS